MRNWLMVAAAFFCFGGAIVHAAAPVAAALATGVSVKLAIVTKTPAAAWILDRAMPVLPDARRAQADDGILDLLFDVQTHWAPGGYDQYERRAVLVVDRSGLEGAARVALSFDPNLGSLTVNHLRIWRDGKIIEHLQSMSISVIQREDSLEDGVVDGWQTAVMEVKDARVGDIIDYASTVRIDKSLWPNHYFESLTPRWSVPVGLYSARLIWPTRFPLTQQSVNTDQRLTVKIDGDNSIYEFQTRDPEPQAGEENIPDWQSPWGRIRYSTMPDWAAVVAWARPFYVIDPTMPATFAAKVDAIIAKYSTPEDRATEILRLVQDEIRYVGNEIGEGSYKPRTPSAVVQAGFGDCKDKAVLLVAALRRAGISADVALANLGRGQGLSEVLPSPTSFNHMIAGAFIGGRRFWLDPTVSHQGGRLPNIAVPDYGFVLPITDDSVALVPLLPRRSVEPNMREDESFTISQTSDVALKLEVVTRYRAAMADDMRGTLGGKAKSELTTNYLEFYAKNYPGLKVAAPIAIKDDRDANVITITENYAMSRAAFDSAGLIKSMPISANAVRDILPKPPVDGRKQPMQVRDHVNREHHIRISDDARAFLESDGATLEEGPLHFSYKLGSDGLALDIATELKTTGNIVSAERVPAAVKLAKSLDDNSSWTVNLTKWIERPATRYKVNAAEIAPYEGEMLKIIGLIRDAKTDDAAMRIDALGRINKLRAKVARPSATAGLFDSFQGLILSTLDRPEAAAAAFAEGLQAYHGNPEFYYLYGYILAQQDNAIGSAQAYAEAASRFPDQTSQLDIKVRRFLGQKLFIDKSKAAMEAKFALNLALAKSTDQRDTYAFPVNNYARSAIDGLVTRNRMAEAMPIAEMLQDPDDIAAILIEKRYQPLWAKLERRAGTGLRAAIENKIKMTKATSLAKPEDPKLLSQYIAALQLAGRYGEALQVGASWLGDPAKVEAAGEDAFWLLDRLASIQLLNGQADAGFATMEKLHTIGIKRYPSLVNQMINYSIRLVENDRPDLGLKVADEVLDAGTRATSPYGRAYLHMVRSCAMFALGRSDDARAEYAAMAGNRNDNIGAFADASICADDSQTLESTMLEMLNDPDRRVPLLMADQLFAATPARGKARQKMYDMGQSLRARPAVKARLDELRRIIRIDAPRQPWSGDY